MRLENFPAHGRIRTRENAEDAVLFREDTAYSRSGINVKRLKFPKVKQTHHAVDVGAGQEDGGHGRSRLGDGGCQVRSSEELLAKIRGSVEEEPVCGAGRDSDLSLRARL